MTLDELFRKIAAKAKITEFDSSINGLIMLELIGEKEPLYWLINFDGGTVTITSGYHDSPDVTVSGEGSTIVKLALKELTPAMAFMTRKIKVNGNSSLLGQLKNLWPD